MWTCLHSEPQTRLTAAVEPEEGVDLQNVTKWFQDHVEGVKPPLEFNLIAGGRSNLTFRVDDSTGAAWVLRRPEPTAAGGAHYQVMLLMDPRDEVIVHEFILYRWGIRSDADVQACLGQPMRIEFSGTESSSSATLSFSPLNTATEVLSRPSKNSALTPASPRSFSSQLNPTNSRPASHRARRNRRDSE